MNHLRLFPTLVAAVFLAVHANAAFPATPFVHSLDVTQFGAKLDGATDDTAAFQRAFDAAPYLSSRPWFRTTNCGAAWWSMLINH